MIGSFQFPALPNLPAQTAILEDDGKWTCTDSSYEDVLNTLFPVPPQRPHQGAWGHAHFHKTAEYFHGTILDPPVDQADEPGKVY